MEERRLTYQSVDGIHQISAFLYMPDTMPPRGVIQLVHGMAEHIDRYRSFAQFLANAGFVVCANNHLGHGGSVSNSDELGHISLAAGKEALIDDVHALRQLVLDQVPEGTPYILFGHSMGSFITRAYLARYAQGVSAAIVCGTGNQPWIMSAAGNLVSRILCACKGETYRSAFIDGLGAGGFAKTIPDARTPLDWISTDKDVVDAYIHDPQCGQMFSVAAYAQLTDLTKEVVTNRHARNLPVDIPLLFISGDQDPVGECGAAVRRAVSLYERAGLGHIHLKLYKGMRHEILNEPDHMRVYQDILTWINQALEH